MTDDEPITEHTATRPSWDCRSCGKPWPCDPAREALAKGQTLTTLAMTMWVNLEEAAGDMPTAPVGEMFERFLSWTWCQSTAGVVPPKFRSRTWTV